MLRLYTYKIGIIRERFWILYLFALLPNANKKLLHPYSFTNPKPNLDQQPDDRSNFLDC